MWSSVDSRLAVTRSFINLDDKNDQLDCQNYQFDLLKTLKILIRSYQEERLVENNPRGKSKDFNQVIG